MGRGYLLFMNMNLRIILNNMIKSLIFMFKVIFCLVYCLIMFIPFAVATYELAFAHHIVDEYSTYFVLFELGLASLSIIMFIALCTKTNLLKKILILISVLFFSYLILQFIDWPSESKNLGNWENCIEDGICKKGVELKAKNIIINEQTCKELNGKWEENICYLK